MSIKKRKNKYFQFIVNILILSTLLTTTIVTFIIQSTSIQIDDTQYRDAFAWQFEKRGVVGLSDHISRAYKEKFTDYIVAKYPIDTLLFGSSTAMSITSDMIEDRTVYNSSKNSNPLYDSISKAEYYISNFDDIKYILIAFDWALGKPYEDFLDTKYEPLDVKTEDMSLLDKIKDAMSYQRVKIVVSNIYNSLFHQPKTYRCPTEDNIGTDAFFVPMVPKNCHGYRFDGSATFSNQRPMSTKKWEKLLDNDLEKYKKMIREPKGKIKAEYLKRLKHIDQILKNKGGRLLVFIPPLAPGAANKIAESSDGKYLQRTMQTLTNFSKDNDILLLDASRSEDFGCKPSDFMDIHHSFAGCYKKIFKTFSFEAR